ncbi:OLC1v1008774C1 [Oldenlandia corymbosa var. corymbosa]|uniref:OLC1v1008774C1 n=1 Tax=Oldenlandia corymbosa var. corymbosa TaxID=529605 RepID=A0AAV1DNW7_OLDCO|nr:OLC1v1008774C1 [Oldenlandia corymbosa var. corymbosa]
MADYRFSTCQIILYSLRRLFENTISWDMAIFIVMFIFITILCSSPPSSISSHPLLQVARYCFVFLVGVPVLSLFLRFYVRTQSSFYYSDKEEAPVPNVSSYPPSSGGVELPTVCCDASTIETPALLTTRNIPPPLLAPEVDKITQRRACNRELYASRVSRMAEEKKQQLLARRRQFHAADVFRPMDRAENFNGCDAHGILDPPLESMVLPTVQNCECCRAKLFPFEPPKFCCSQDKVSLVSHPMPYALRRLFIGLDEESVEFRKNIRSYNNNFAFTSLGVTYDRDLTMNTRGMYTFRPNGHSPSGVQLYFYDEHEEISWRMQSTDKFNKSTLQLLSRLLSSNPDMKFFRNLRYVPDLDQKQIVLSCTPDLDQRRYNLPSCDQVAAIFRETEYGNRFERGADIRVYTESDESYHVRHYYACMDPLQYPILFPGGQSGWHRMIPRHGVGSCSCVRETADLFSREAIAEMESPEDISALEEQGKFTLMVESSILCSQFWLDLQKHFLTENMQAALDPDFSSFLLRIGEGVEPVDEDGNITLPFEMVVPYDDRDSALNRLVKHFSGLLCLLDNEGTCVEAICFNHEIQRMGGRLHLFKKYRIRNAQVKKIPEKYKGNDDIEMQWIINGRTFLEEIAVCENTPVKMNFTDFTDIPQFVDIAKKTIGTFSHSNCFVNATLPVLCGWGRCQGLPLKELAGERGTLTVQKYVIVNEKVENNFKTLQAYVDAGEFNQNHITMDSAQVQNYSSISAIKNGDKIGWVKVMVTFRHILQNFWYMGCQKASELGLVYPCNGCGLSQKASPRCRLEADITDHSDTLRGVLLGEDAEKILAHAALEFMKAGHEGKEIDLTDVHDSLSSKIFSCLVKLSKSKYASEQSRFLVQCLSEANFTEPGPSLPSVTNTHAQQGVHTSGDAEAISVLPKGVSVSEPKAKLCLDSKLAGADAVKGDSTNDGHKAKRPKRG